MDRWQVLKNGIPVQICNTIEEAEDVYLKHDCDCIKRVEYEEDTKINVSNN